MLKANENPPVIWPSNSSVADFNGTWWVAHTKSRNEKALAWQMQKADINYFLPMAEKVSRRNRRVFKSLLPLFSGYVFFCGDEEARLAVLKTNRVANLIEVADSLQLVKDLLPIEKALAGGFDIQPYEHLQTGRRCKVVAGALMGTEGVVVTHKNKTKLVLQVDILGQSSWLEIDPALIEAVE